MTSPFDNNFKPKTIKDPKGSARQKYNRRKNKISWALDELEFAIEDLFSQKGPIYKREEAEQIRNAIKEFRKRTGIVTPELDVDTQSITDALDNATGQPPPTPEEKQEFDKTLEELRQAGYFPPLDNE